MGSQARRTELFNVRKEVIQWSGVELKSKECFRWKFPLALKDDRHIEQSVLAPEWTIPKLYWTPTYIYRYQKCVLDLVTLTYRAKCIGPQLTFIVYHKWVLDFIPLGYFNVSSKVYQSQSEQPPKCIEPNLRWGQAGLKGHQSEVGLRRGPRHLSIYIGINACVTNAGRTNDKPGKIGLLSTRLDGWVSQPKTAEQQMHF